MSVKYLVRGIHFYSLFSIVEKNYHLCEFYFIPKNEREHTQKKLFKNE